jgi:kynurenine formamidase
MKKSLLLAALVVATGCERAPQQAAAPTEAEVTERSKAAVSTGPWPQGDERGMANTLGPGTWARCAYYLAQPGARSYELSHVRSNTMPLSPFGQPLAYQYTPSVSLPGTRHVFNGERVLGGEPGAQGTQMDALGHFAFYDEAWDGKGDAPASKAHYYGGYTQADVKPVPDSSLLKLGIEKAPPIITSAVLLDAKGHVGKGSTLQPGTLVTAAHIQEMLQAQGIASRGILPGDVVYIYTGWGDQWQDPDTDKSYYTRGPGLAYDGAQYLAERKVVLIALDNPFTDAVADGQLAQKAKPPQGMDQGLPFIIHHQNLAVAGIHQIQNANLGELARDKVWTSCTMVLPLRERGNAGSPVRPVAIGVPR